MRTLLIPPLFLAIYASILLTITVLITPGGQPASYSMPYGVVGCFLAGRMGIPPALRGDQPSGEAGDFVDDIEAF